MINLWGEIVTIETKICRDCKEEKPIEQFSVNRKFYREDLPEKHYAIRRPACDSCRNRKVKIGKEKKFWHRPTNLTCPICHDEVLGSYARLDHNHHTGKIRGWICDNCNTAIGKLKESSEVMQRAIEWIKNDTI